MQPPKRQRMRISASSSAGRPLQAPCSSLCFHWSSPLPLAHSLNRRG